MYKIDGDTITLTRGDSFYAVVSMEDIDEALIRSINSTISHVLGKGSILDVDTVAARNFLVQQKRMAQSAV